MCFLPKFHKIIWPVPILSTNSTQHVRTYYIHMWGAFPLSCKTPLQDNFAQWNLGEFVILMNAMLAKVEQQTALRYFSIQQIARSVRWFLLGRPELYMWHCSVRVSRASIAFRQIICVYFESKRNYKPMCCL